MKIEYSTHITARTIVIVACITVFLSLTISRCQKYEHEMILKKYDYYRAIEAKPMDIACQEAGGQNNGALAIICAEYLKQGSK